MTTSRPPLPVVVATILRDEGSTGVQTHFRQLDRYLAGRDAPASRITPFSRRPRLVVPVFGVRLALQWLSGSASVSWYRHWHEAFLRDALRKELAAGQPCVVYAQCPVSARAALQARRGPRQRVVMAVHFRVSQADEWVNMRQITPGGRVFERIRRDEREVIPQVDGLVFVSEWARRALLDWFPEAAGVNYAVIGNFAASYRPRPDPGPAGDLVTIGHLEPVKNHRFMLEVLAAARGLGRSLSLDIFGDGPLEAELRQAAAALGVADQVRFRGYRKDVRDFLPGYRAYVHASYSESSSLAIMEAMDAGLPIVAGKIGPIPELLDDGVEGRFWSLDDPAEAARLLVEFLGDEAAREQAASAAKKRFARDYDASAVAPRLASFLQACISPAHETSY